MHFAQGELPEETVDYAANFATFAGVVGVTTVVTEFIKKLFKTEPSEWVQRIISWVIGIGLGMFAWGFHLGMFEGLDWWQALLWGFGAGLASNGFGTLDLSNGCLDCSLKRKQHNLFHTLCFGRGGRVLLRHFYKSSTLNIYSL